MPLSPIEALKEVKLYLERNGHHLPEGQDRDEIVEMILEVIGESEGE